MIQLAASPHTEQSEAETLLVLESENQFERVWHDVFNVMQKEILKEQVERMRGQMEWQKAMERK